MAVYSFPMLPDPVSYTHLEGFHWGMIRGGQSSVADLFIAQMQDYLGLGADSRMNTPGDVYKRQ